MRRKFWRLLMAVSVILIVLSVYQLYKIYSEYGEAAGEYESLKSYVRSADNRLDEEADDDDDEKWDIDFDSLRKINPDIVGWLYMPACDISYPIVQSDNNSDYLGTTFEKTKNKSGAIFMDCECNADFSDFNTIIYGHNMKNGTMFGALKKLYQEANLRSSNPYFFIIGTDNHADRYEIFSYYIDKSLSNGFVLTNTEEENRSYISKAMSKTIENTGVEVSPEDKIVTLATCSGRAGGNKRFFVHGKKIVRKK